MIDIKINITNKIANAIGTPFIVCGNSDYTVTFTFDAEWGAYQEKTARFFFVSDGIEQYIDVLFSGNTCNAPVLPNIEKVLIGVYTGNLRTTTGAEVRCKRSILFGGKVHEPPKQEDYYNEILEIVSKKLGSEGGTVTGDYYKDGNTFIHEGNLDLLDNHFDNRSNITATASGSAITVESSKAPLQNLQLFGKTTQNGTPTPTAPKELKSVGDSGSFEVGVYSRNILNITIDNLNWNGVPITNNGDGSVTVNGTSNDNWTIYVLGSVYLPAGTYKAINYGDYTTGYLQANAQGNIVLDCYGGGTAPKEFTLTKGGQVNFNLVILPNTTVNNVTFKPMVMRVEITDETYEPCNKQSLTMPYTLRSDKSGVTDEIDLKRGVHIQKAKVLSLAVANMNITEDVPGGWVSGLTECIPVNTNILVDCFNNVGQTIEVNTKNNNLFVILPKNIYGLTQTEWKTNYPDLVVKIILPLITPIETPLSETELNAYRQLYTNKGTTTILSECEDTEVTYYVNKPNAQAIGSLHEQINKDYFKLQQAIISTGGNV